MGFIEQWKCALKIQTVDWYWVFISPVIKKSQLKSKTINLKLIKSAEFYADPMLSRICI